MDEKWHENHKAGMQAAAAKTARNRMSGETLARVRRESRERHPCKAKGCKRTAHKGQLCKGHWDMVPLADKVALTMAVYEAQIKTADKYHRQFLRELNARLATPARV